MKLTDMNTRQMAEALCALTPPVCRIAQSSAVAQALEAFSESGEEHAPLAATLGKAFEVLLPALLTEHLQDLCEILSVLTGKSTEILLSQSGLATVRDLKDVWDSDLMDFFVCAGSAVPKKY